jgi:gliding motility-associated-like protein
MQLYRSFGFKPILLLMLFAGSCVYSFASVRPSVQPPEPGIKLIENKGQWPAEVLFKANIPGGDVFVTASGLVYQFIDEQALHALSHDAAPNPIVKGHTYKMTFASANATIVIDKQIPSYENYNYFIGDDAQSWASGCKAYQKVVLQNIYAGIDAELVAQSDYLKLNFIVHPYANPYQIQLAYEGMDKLSLKNQSLMIQTTVATVKEDKPLAFQGESPVSCAYTLTDKQVQFVLGEYAVDQPLVIDPEIIFGTYSGSVADNFGFTGTYDEAGNGFAAGTVFSSGFPTTTGAFQLTFAGGTGSARDIGVLKFSADGKQLLYATYLGGSNNEQPHSLICNAAGELYILGTTQSTNFPTSAGAFDRTHNGANDIIVAKLSANGQQLLASTFWGGTDDDGLNGSVAGLNSYHNYNPLTYNYGDFYRGEIILDQNNQVYIASTTQSSPLEGYPLLGAFQNTFGGGTHDGIIFSLNSNLTAINFSTYLGGSGVDALYGLRFDSQHNLIVCGGTQSSNLPSVQNPTFAYHGSIDGFVAKLNTSFTLQKLIYLGTSFYDQTYFLDLDGFDNIYVTGQTLGAYPVKGSVYQNTAGKQFISIINPSMDTLLYSTVIGDGSAEVNFSPSAFMVDQCGKVYLSGWGGGANNQFNNSTGTTNGLTVTPDAFQSTTDGSDFYLIILSENLASLKYATFMGGRFSADHVDGGTSRFDKQGMVYQSICAGCGGYSDLPVTPGCYSPTNNGKRPGSNAGGCNNALIKFSADPYDFPPLVRDTFLTVIATDTLSYGFHITNPIGDSLIISFSGAVLATTNPPLITQVNNGKTADVAIKWFTQCENASSDTFVITVETQSNGCFGFRAETAVIKILVKFPPAIIPPFPNCLKTINDSTIRISWTETTYGRYFKKLEVYKSISGSPFIYLGQSLNESDTIFVDNHAIDHLTTNICYYFVGTNICDSVSAFPSKYVCSLYPYDSADHLFEAPNDTLVYLTATDTLDFTFTAETINPSDSIFITASGNVFQTNRVLSTFHQPKLNRSDFHLVWKSSCDDLDLTDTLTVRFLIRDNQCPQSRTKQTQLKIIVLPPPLYNPPIMKCTRNTGKDGVLVRWGQLAIPNKRYFSRYVLIRKNPDGSLTELAGSSSDTAFSFIDNNATDNNSVNYCYAVYAVNVCAKAGDTSNFVCTVAKTTTEPDPLYIYTTTVVNNDYINVQWAKSGANDFLKYQVFKEDVAGTNGYVLIHESTDKNDTTVNDQAADVHHFVYCYEIKQVNDCGASNSGAYHACSILLKGESNPFEHSLNWNDYDFWKNGLDHYSLLRTQPNLPEEEINRFAYKNTHAVDDNLNIENGLYHYTIRAKELNSPYTSISNTVELIQAPLLHVPNVFTANGDGLNDVWKPVPAFVKDYTLKIYNRWGQLVFETNDQKQPFTGAFSGTPTTSDVFVYLITYTGWDGSSQQVKGNLTQLK